MPRSLDSVNEQLRREHGSTGSCANYTWKLAGECRFPAFNGQWEHKADPDSGLILARPQYELKSMCRTLNPKQWVLCRFLAAPDEATWKNVVGLTVQHPGAGYYAPSNVVLDLGINPWDESRGMTVTDAVIAFAKQDRDKTHGQVMREGQAAIDAREAATDAALEEQIGDLLLPFANAPHVPGKRGGPVSTPFTKQDSASLKAGAPPA